MFVHSDLVTFELINAVKILGWRREPTELVGHSGNGCLLMFCLYVLDVDRKLDYLLLTN